MERLRARFQLAPATVRSRRLDIGLGLLLIARANQHRSRLTQQVDQRVLQLRQRSAPRVHGWFRAQVIGFIRTQPLGRVLGAQAAFKVSAQRQGESDDVDRQRGIRWRDGPCTDRTYGRLAKCALFVWRLLDMRGSRFVSWESCVLIGASHS